jgi:hypothetical protein
LNGGPKKGRLKKSSPMRVATKYFNSEVVETEMVPDKSAEQCTIARRKVIYLPEYDLLLLYAACITKEPSIFILLPYNGVRSIQVVTSKYTSL